MDRVEFNGNVQITIDEIYNFIAEKLIAHINPNSLITLEDIKDILEKIKKITNGSEIVTDNQLLEIIKILLPYKIMNYFGGQVIHKHYDVGRNQFLKYKIVDNELCLYDNALTKGRQRKIKVQKINGINIQNIIEKLNLDSNTSNTQIENILMRPELLKAIGIDVTEEYNLTLLTEDNPPKEITFSLTKISDNPNFVMFEKEYQSAEILNKENFQTQTNQQTNEDYTKKLTYSYDSCQKLLQMLLGFSKSNQDIELFNKVIQRQLNYNINANSDEYLDWMFMSSFLLFNEQKIKELSDDTYDSIITGLSNYYNCYYLDKNNEKVSKIGDKFLREIGYNKALINDQTNDIDYKKLIKLIRNALAHSSYEVIDENYIRCYGTNFNVIVNKNLVKRIISELVYNTNLNNIFPLFYFKHNQIETYYKQLENEEELKNFLENISFISINQVEIKKDKIDNEFKEIIERFKKNRFFSTLIGTKNIAKLTYSNSKIKEFIQINFPEDGKDNQVDIDYVINEIRKYRSDFYRHSLYYQHQIILEIIREKELSEKGISQKIFNIIETKEKTTGNIIDTIARISPIEYVNYGKYIQAAFIAYLNSLLVYPCNDRYNQINCGELSLDKTMQISLIIDDGRETSKEEIRKGKFQELKQKQEHLTNLTKEKENFLKDIERRKKLLTNKAFIENAPPSVVEKERESLREALARNQDGEYEKQLDAEIEIAKNDLVEAELKIKNVDKIINNKYHQIIIEHLRNSLAHGRIKFINGFDFNNIGDTTIHFEDYAEDEINHTKVKTFDATIKLSDLVLELSEEKFLQSIFPQELSEEQNRRRNA